jgi:hypothetical protein
MKIRFALSLTLATLSPFLCLNAHALGDPNHVVFQSQPHAFAIASTGHPASILVGPADWPGVTRAATSFAADVASVTGNSPAILHTLTTSPDRNIILIGTIGRSPLIDRLIASHKLDVASIQGHWESSLTQVVDHPFPGITSALVIAGADKRGTIFGIYDLSEQIGVSPWAWWADVPIPHHDSLYLAAGRYIQPTPRVKYRGIFLNDEAPALSGWTQEKFGGYNHLFYEHVFELLLRLKANFLWPAMWNSAFNEDDPADPILADEYGIVMGTSHHEPMMRAQQEWKRHGTGPWDYTLNKQELDDFWRYGVRRNKNFEELTTIGMRGDGDMAMSADTNTALLERIVADQRKILSEEVNPDVTKVPQVWALYKEVQGYYEKGMRVPDDVTLLWCDDNWGNLRRVPTPAERSRAGGAGIYYHFDYVGDPRNYKWINTNSIPRVWEQMNIADAYGADRLWIVNVGDLKPMEFPIEFFLTMARDPAYFNANNLDDYTQAWVTRQFGPEHATEIASLISTYTQYNSRRKPELLDPNTYSLTVDHEADRIEQQWQDLVARAQRVNTALPEDYRPAFFELVLHPILASATVGEMYIAAGRNRLYAEEGRASANLYADETRKLFAQDAAISDEYNHQLLNGKWNHMMDQTHIGYTTWQQPALNAMPAVQQIQPLTGAHMVVFPEGPFTPEGAGPAGIRALPTFDSVNRQTRTIDLANRGTQPFTFTATASAPWVHLSSTSGEVTTDQRLSVTIDYSQLSPGSNTASITIRQKDSGTPSTTIPVIALQAPSGNVRGYVEDAGTVTIDAEHTAARRPANGLSWQTIPGLGNTLSAVETFPVNAPSTLMAAQQPCLDYDFYLFTPGERSVQTVLAPTLPFLPGRGLRYTLAVDTKPPVTIDAWSNYSEMEWRRAVADNVRKVSTPLGTLTAGTHSLHLCRVDAGLTPERIIIYQGDHPPATYLGPPESINPAIPAATASTPSH